MEGHSKQKRLEPVGVREPGSFLKGNWITSGKVYFAFIPHPSHIALKARSFYRGATSGFAFLGSNSPCYEILPLNSHTAIRNNLPAMDLISLGIKVRTNLMH